MCGVRTFAPSTSMMQYGSTATQKYIEELLIKSSNNSSVIRQKGKPQNECFRGGVRNVSFLENLAFFVFLKYPF